MFRKKTGPVFSLIYVYFFPDGKRWKEISILLIGVFLKNRTVNLIQHDKIEFLFRFFHGFKIGIRDGNIQAQIANRALA